MEKEFSTNSILKKHQVARGKLSMPCKDLGATAMLASNFIIILFFMIGVFAQSATAQVPTQGLVAYYSFNGNANDESGNGNHGTIMGTPAFVPGIRNNCINLVGNGVFGATGDHVLLPTIDFNNMSNFTINIWVNEQRMTYHHGEAYIGYGDHYKGSVIIRHMEDFIWFNVGGLNAADIRIPFEASYLNKWMFYSLVYSSGTLKGYVNGNLVGTAIVSVNVGTSDAAIGRHWFGNETATRFKGMIDEVSIYNRALSEKEIKHLAGSSEPPEIGEFQLKLHRLDGLGKGVDISGICADGASSIVLEVVGKNIPQGVTFDATVENADMGKVYVPNKLAVNYWFANWKQVVNQTATTNKYIKYVAPEGLNSNSVSEGKIKFTVYIPGSKTLTKEIKLIRPPVMLLHGKGDDATRWRQFDDYFKVSGNGKIKRSRIDYSEMNEASFKTNNEINKVVQQGILILKNRVAKEGFVSQKVDIVAHSMGGVLSRPYLQSGKEYKNDIHKLITVSTPHSGSQGSSLLYSLKETGPGSMILLAALTAANMNYISPATENLRHNSTAITEYLNGVDKLSNQHCVPSFAIATYINNNKKLKDYAGKVGYAMQLAVTAACKAKYTGGVDIGLSMKTEATLLLLYQESHDIVVPLSSQLGGMSVQNSKTFDDDWHDGVTSNAKVWGEIMNLLLAKSNDPRFAQNGWRPPTLKMLDDILKHPNPKSKTSLQADGFISFGKTENSPREITVQAGSKFDIWIRNSSDVIEKSLLLTGDGYEVIREVKDNSTEYCFEEVMPDSAYGDVRGVIYGITADSDLYLDTLLIHVIPKVALQSIYISDPEELFLELYNGEIGKVNVKGKFSDNKDRDITGFSDVKYVFKHKKAAIVEPGVIRANAVGEDTLIVSYQGQTTVLPIRILPIDFTVLVVPSGSGKIGYKLESASSSEIYLPSTDTVSFADIVKMGDNITLSAKADLGNKFVGWMRNGEIVSNDISYTYSIVGEEMLVALFESKTEILEDTHTLSCSISPNPADSYLNFNFTLEQQGQCNINIYDEMGDNVLVISKDHCYDAGLHTETISTMNLPVGRYFCRIEVDGVYYGVVSFIVIR